MQQLRGQHVYFIQSVRGGLIKIGSANDPHHRLGLIQKMCPVRLRILGVMWGKSSFWERGIHLEFDHLRRHGEWFTPAPELLAYIAEHATDPHQLPEGDSEAAS